jgi:thioesterase domain-containing protein
MLIAAGERVEIVGMIDTPTVNGRRPIQFLIWTLRHLRPIGGPIVDRIAARAWYICSQVDTPLTLLKSWFARVFKWRTDERSSTVTAMSMYSPKPLRVPVIFFAADYGSRGWRRLCSHIETITMDGNHAQVVRDPTNLASIAQHLKLQLQAHA